MWHAWEGREMHVGFWLGKPDGTRPIGIPKHRWDDINLNLKAIEWEDVDWVHLA